MLLRIYRIVQPVAIFLGNFFVQCLVKRQRLDLHLRRINLLKQFLDRADDLLDLRVPEFQRVYHRFFGDFQRAGFHHHNRVFRAGNHNVQQTFLLVRNGWICHQLPIEQSHAHGSNRLLERQVRDIAGRRSPRNRDHIRIVIAIGGQYHADDLCFIAP